MIAATRAEVEVLDPSHDRDVFRLSHVTIDRGWDAHDGAGWYLHLDEHPEEGSIGAFATRAEAIMWVHADGSILLDKLTKEKP